MGALFLLIWRMSFVSNVVFGFCSSFSCGIKVLIGGLDCGRMSCCCCYLKVGGVVCGNGEKQ